MSPVLLAQPLTCHLCITNLLLHTPRACSGCWHTLKMNFSEHFAHFCRMRGYFGTLLQSREDPRGQNILATQEGVKNHNFTLPTKTHYVDRAAQKEEEGTESLNPRQITPPSISTPVCTMVSVGSWQRPELSSLLSWWSKGWVRTGGSTRVLPVL